MNKTYEELPEVEKIAFCEEFIEKLYEAHDCKGIEINVMFDLAEKAGLYTKGVYGSAFSQALDNVVNVVWIHNESGDWIYSVFRLK